MEQVNLKNYSKVYLLGLCMNILVLGTTGSMWLRALTEEANGDVHISYSLTMLAFLVTLLFLVFCNFLLRKHESNSYLDKPFKVKLTLAYFAGFAIGLLYLPSFVQSLLFFLSTGIPERADPTFFSFIYLELVAKGILFGSMVYLIVKTPSLFRITKRNFEQMTMNVGK